MNETNEHPYAPVIEAAGGLLWRTTASGREIAIIHRPRYDDWTLPKGKRDPGESWQETAQRELGEETGYEVLLTSFAGSIAYTVKGVAKVVLFWNMALKNNGEFQENSEVDILVWLPVEAALKKMTYALEIALLQSHSA